ncbi:MAG TPA: fibronectin type III domain-containing protein [Candidatus Nitrosotenuis sp.]|nr:fibronectin type III domain-containing protein [Candidatus Nitrosotenuis sp.]
MKIAGTVLLLLVATLAAPLEYAFAQNADVSNPPTNLSAHAVSDSQVNLSWNAPVNSTVNGVNGYKIERDVGCFDVFSVHVANTTTTITIFSDTNLIDNFCYAYKVSALTPLGSSNSSNTASATTLSVSSAPTGLNVTTVSSTSLRLNWNTPAADGGAQITGYQIQRNGTILVSNTANNQTTYLDNNLLPAHQQTYRVAAWNSIGLGPFSANVTAKTSNQTGTPTPIDKENLGQAIADFVHKRNELFKQQREETLKIIRECHDKSRNVNATERKQIKEDCRELLDDLKKKYKESRQQFKEEFKQFRETTKSILNIAKKDKLIDKGDVKEIEKEFKVVKNEMKHEEKQLKQDVKELKKELKEQTKELKKENKEKKKNSDEDDEEEDDD